MTSSPVASFTSGGPAENSDAPSTITTKSMSGAVSAPCPADGPITTATVGTSPDRCARVWRSFGARPRRSNAFCVRSPAPSSSMTSGTRSCPASSARRWRLAVVPRPIEPPMTVKSSAPTRTGRPSTSPCPAISPSAGTGGTTPRCTDPTSVPSSTNVPSSSNRSTRVRASRRPSRRCCSSRSLPPIARAASRRAWRSLSSSSQLLIPGWSLRLRRRARRPSRGRCRAPMPASGTGARRPPT